jgi:hypothetical protein
MNKSMNQRSTMQQLLGVLFNRPVVPQRGLVSLDENTTKANTLPTEPNTFERIEEYRAILENHAQLSARRQHVNDLYVGLNTIFLTALGILLLQSHLDTWWIFAVISTVTLIIMPINITWRAALLRYADRLSVRYEYLREVEQEFRTRRGKVADQPEVGLFLRLKETGLHHHKKSNTQLEVQLAVYFICLYPVISLMVGILVYLVEAHLIPPLNIV